MTSIHQEVLFNAPPARMYRALVDAGEFSKATGPPNAGHPARGAAFSGFGGCRALDVAGQRLQRLLPEGAIAIDERARRLQRFTDQVAVVVPPVALAPQQARSLENAQVLRDRGEGHVERLRQLTYGRGPRRKAREDSPARAVRKRGEDRVELVVVGFANVVAPPARRGPGCR